MKQSILLAITIALSIYTYSQSFKVTPEGIVSSTDSSKHFVVIHIDSLSAKELYAKSYSYIQHNWKNPDIANNGKVEGEFLHVKTYAANALTAKGNLGMKIYVNLRYSLNLDFKDGKIKYEIVDLEMDTKSTSGASYPFDYRASGMVWALYNKDGTPTKKQQATREQLEEYFNSQMVEFINAVKSATSARDDF